MFTTAFMTERLVGLPGMNDSLLNYERTRLVDRIDLTNLQKKQVMLAHGMANRTVLLESTMMLCKRLVDENIIFKQQVQGDF